MQSKATKIKFKEEGFGFNYHNSTQHILVDIPRGNGEVLIYERFNFNPDNKVQIIDEDKDLLKAKISKDKWNLIKDILKDEFNNRLKNEERTLGKWKVGQNLVEKSFGKELLFLVWGIEDCEKCEVQYAIKNWKGLAPVERWWLFTMTNAASGKVDDRYGWRRAIKIILVDNPINDEERTCDNECKIKGECPHVNK